MQIGFRAVAAVIMVTLAVSACGNRNKEPNLVNFPRSGTPDEFAVLPSKPLEAPESYAALPTPTPGGTNLTDPTPQADAVAALGGRPASAAVARDNVLGADGNLLAYSSRFGSAPGIRQTLATEDLAFRRDNDGRLLERWFNVNIYYKAYRDQSLDQHQELLRLRRLGIRTPAAPPNPEG